MFVFIEPDERGIMRMCWEKDRGRTRRELDIGNDSIIGLEEVIHKSILMIVITDLQ